MNRIRALNESESESEDDNSRRSSVNGVPNHNIKITEEAEESLLEERYREALLHLANSRQKEAKVLFQEILNSAILSRVENSQGKSDTLRQTLFYAVCKNLATISAEESDHKTAAELYIRALRIDDTEALTWYKYGIETFKIDQFYLARMAFEKSLEINSNFWPCVDKIISLLFMFGDFSDCLAYIEKALDKDDAYLRGLVIKDEIFRRSPYLEQLTSKAFAKFPQRSYDAVVALEIVKQLDVHMERIVESTRDEALRTITPNCIPANVSMTSVGDAITSVYDSLLQSAQLANPLDIGSWIEKTKASDTNLESNEVTISNQDVQVVEDINEKNGTAEPREIALVSTQESFDNNESALSEQEMESTLTADDSASASDFSTKPDTNQRIADDDSPAPVTASNKRGLAWKRKQPSDNVHVFKRRSTRLIPGFYMEDPDAFGPLTTKPMGIREHLRSYMSHVFRYFEEKTEQNAEIRDATAVDNRDKKEFRVASLEHSFADEDVRKFLEGCQNYNVTNMLRRYLKLLERRSTADVGYSFSDELRTVFRRCFERWNADAQQLTPLNTDFPLSMIREEALVRLLYVELCWKDNPADLMKICAHLSFVSTFRETFGDEWLMFRCRLEHTRACIAEKQRDFDTAVQCLHRCRESLSDLSEMSLTLAHIETRISIKSLDDRLRTLERVCQFEHVERLVETNDHAAIVEILALPEGLSLQEGVADQFRRYSTLSKSYRQLGNVRQTILSLVEALKAGRDVYRTLEPENRCDWWSEIGRLLEIGEWTVSATNVNQCLNALSSVRISSLCDSMIDLISLLDEFPLTKQVTEYCWLSPWMILYQISRTVEWQLFDEALAKEWYEKANSCTVILATRSLMILWKAHEELGRKKMCMLRNGAFLMTLAHEIQRTLRLPLIANIIPSSCSNDTLNCAEQCLYCLHKYPQKKRRHLEEHDATPVELTWENAGLLFDFVRPDNGPEFDDQPHATTSAEAAQLFHRIEAIVPTMLKPDQLEKPVIEFLEKPNDDGFPQLAVLQEPIIGELYHLLADYYLKTQDFVKAVRYYQLDLCVGADRFDSWAGLAMGRGFLLDSCLSSTDLTYNSDTWDNVTRTARSALYCYERATKSRPDHYVLLVEYGTLAYALHSFFSRSIKHKGSQCDADTLTRLKRLRKSFLLKAKRAFENASAAAVLPTVDQKEEWIYNYFLGKITEKLDGERRSPILTLKFYHQAAYHLHRDGARYPDRIRYSPQRYALEILEVFYRVHACALKWILAKRTDDDKLLLDVWRLVSMFQHHPFAEHTPNKAEARSALRLRMLTSAEIVSVMDDLLLSVDDNLLSSSAYIAEEYSPKKLRDDLLQWCSDAFQLCLRRFNNHFKSYYWLSKIYYAIEERKDLTKCRQILLGPVSIPDCQVHTGLFQHRKPSNFFENVWRIPIDDINRAGSFAEHMRRSIRHLCAVLGELNDYQALIDLVLALHRKPSQEKQKYLLEIDRQELLQSISDKVEKTLRHAYQSTSSEKENIILSLYRLYSALQKMQLASRERWSQLLKRLVASYTKTDAQAFEMANALSYCAAMEQRNRNPIVGLSTGDVHPNPLKRPYSNVMDSKSAGSTPSHELKQTSGNSQSVESKTGSSTSGGDSERSSKSSKRSGSDVGGRNSNFGFLPQNVLLNQSLPSFSASSTAASDLQALLAYANLALPFGYGSLFPAMNTFGLNLSQQASNFLDQNRDRAHSSYTKDPKSTPKGNS